MKDQMVIVVLDHEKKHLRKWPLRLEGISIRRKSLEDCLTSDDNVLLYAFHVRDFISFPETKKGIFIKEEKLWPINVLWYSGGDIKEDYPKFTFPGHVYKKIVPHKIGNHHCFFSNIRRLIRRIAKEGITENVISEQEISESLWNILYPSNTHINDKQRADDIVRICLHYIQSSPRTYLVVESANIFINNKNANTYVTFYENFNNNDYWKAGRKELQDKLRVLNGLGFGLTDYPVLNELKKQFNILNNIDFPAEYPENKDKRKDIIGKVRKVIGVCQQIEQLGGDTASNG
jgi:hypothetical protein